MMEKDLKRLLKRPPCEPLMPDGVTPPPWNIHENREITKKYIVVMLKLEQYDYTIKKK